MKCLSLYWHVLLDRIQSSLKVLTEKVAPCFSSLLVSVHSPEAGLELGVSHHELRTDGSHICSDLLILKPHISWKTDFVSEGFSHSFYTLGYVNAKMYTNVHVFAFSFLQNHSASMTEVT